jgi:hypothetical protein
MRISITGSSPTMRGALPNAVVIGAMKSGTTALHRYLDAHPEVSMAQMKEANFFSGPATAPSDDESRWWVAGQWHRGVEWYATLFDPCARVRGETSPGYTSPDHPEVAERMASVVPDARLVYLVRDPVDRAVSQYAHHQRDGAETRSMEQAILDPDSQYLSRSRYHERLLPFLEHFAPQQIQVVVQERLLHHRRRELRLVYQHLGAAPDWWHEDLEQRFHVGAGRPASPPRLRAAVLERVHEDLDGLRELASDDFPEWEV